jgi:uncharacterized protein
MDSGLYLTLFLASTFIAAFVAGMAGFAFGLVAAAVWLYILTPLQTATLIIGFGLLVQGYAVWKLRKALGWNRLWPFLVGAAVGVPPGVAIVSWVAPSHMRTAIGAVLVLYSLYAFLRPTTPPIKAGGAAADAGIGILNGLLGGATGLAGIIATIWCQMRGWPKDQQRAVFQPIGVATFAMSAAWLGGKGAITSDAIWLFLLGLPALLLGTWTGLKLYGRLNEANFRMVVLALLFISGIALII